MEAVVGFFFVVFLCMDEGRVAGNMGNDGGDENCRVFAVEAGDGELRGSGFRTGGKKEIFRRPAGGAGRWIVV